MENKITQELLTEMEHMYKLMGISPTILTGDIEMWNEEDCGCKKKSILSEGQAGIGGLGKMMDDVLLILSKRPKAPVRFTSKISKAVKAGKTFGAAVFEKMGKSNWTVIDDVVEFEKHLVNGRMADDFKQSFKDVLSTSINDGGYNLKMSSQVDGIPIGKIIDDAFDANAFDQRYKEIMEMAIDSLKKTGEIPPTLNNYINDIAGLESKLKKSFAKIVDDVVDAVDGAVVNEHTANSISFWLRSSIS